MNEFDVKRYIDISDFLSTLLGPDYEHLSLNLSYIYNLKLRAFFEKIKYKNSDLLKSESYQILIIYFSVSSFIISSTCSSAVAL